MKMKTEEQSLLNPVVFNPLPEIDLDALYWCPFNRIDECDVTQPETLVLVRLKPTFDKHGKMVFVQPLPLDDGWRDKGFYAEYFRWLLHRRYILPFVEGVDPKLTWRNIRA